MNQSPSSSVATGSVVNVLVRQVTPDTIAATATYAVVERFQEKDIQSVRRAEYWKLTWNETPQEAERLTHWLLETSAEFVHPSKHQWRVIVNEDCTSFLPATDSGKTAGVIVVADSDRTPFDAMRKGLIELYPQCKNLAGLERATWWELTYATDLSTSELQRHLTHLAETQSRTEGLFAHPHYQETQILLPRDND